MWNKIKVPGSGHEITIENDKLIVPGCPLIPFIEGDGIGRDIWRAAKNVFDGAIQKAYNGDRKVAWVEIFAGEKAKSLYDEWLPQETLDAISHFHVAIKGPLTTPIGGGIRSLNVTLRQKLDLYACVRPIEYFNGVPTPLLHPERLNVVIFRENTEDVYSGIEWEKGSADAKKMIELLKNEFNVSVRDDSGLGVKPISVEGSKRLVRKAVQFAIDQNRRSVTLVHKGNIMKFTEGAFKQWGYDLVKEEFKDTVISEDELWDTYNGEQPEDKIVIKDRIADAMFQQVLLRPDEYDVIATTNLNGDYLSDACAACVGGLGLAPGANIGDSVALFEATHGTAPKYTDLDKVNPGSVILSGAMMFDHIGWHDVSSLIKKGVQRAINNKTVTYDLHRQMDGATKLKCSEFGEAIINNM